MHKVGTKAFDKISDEKKNTVIQAALEEFSEKGYGGSSMNSICKSAGISKGSLFFYFNNKKDLFHSIVNFAVNLVKTHLRNARDRTENENFYVRLEKIIFTGFDFIDNHPRLAKIYFNFLQSTDSPLGARIVSDLHEQSRRFLGELTAAGIDSGEIDKAVNPERTAYFINTLLDQLMRGYFLEYLSKNLDLYNADKRKLREWVEDIVDFVKYGISIRENSK